MKNKTPRKILIVSSSMRRVKTPLQPIPAIQRYDGVYFRVIRKYMREGLLKNVRILFLTDKFGLVEKDALIPYYEPTSGAFGELTLDKKEKMRLNKRNLEIFQEISKKEQVDEIYINVGSRFIDMLRGIEGLTSSKITYAKGAGLGPKAAHMRDWILNDSVKPVSGSLKDVPN